MPVLFPIDSMVTVTKQTTVPVAGHAGDHTGRVGKVRGYVDLAPLYKGGDVLHIIDLCERNNGHAPVKWYGEPFHVPNETPNPTDQYGRRIHGDMPLPEQRVDWIEVPASCLS